MGKGKRGVRDGTGPFWDSFAKRSGGGGRKERCYEKKEKKGLLDSLFE